MRTVVIRMPNWLGDLVMATPMIEEAKRCWPGSEITVICKDPLVPLLEGNPHLKEVIPLSKAHPASLHYDIGLLLTNSFSSAWLFYRAKIKKRIGYMGDWRRFLLSHAIPRPLQLGKEHLVDSYKRLLNVPFSDSKPFLYLRAQERKEARTRLRRLGVPKDALCIGINPTAAFGPAKCWLPERFRELTTRFPDAYFLFFGDKAGIETVQGICQGLPASVINLAGQTTLREFMALLTCCDILVTNDSGPMHVAAALQIPLVALFGSTNATATGPYLHGTVIYKNAPCSPCYKRTCPIDFRCMTAISVNEVEAKIHEVLKATQPLLMKIPQ
ncbi:MAG: lipopolysaccharide heptosyltransferase II [Verrucomicrobia bacterium]|nr:lipopolysaccharide heptosyltransferase II [Verrucomicrobiota bacterium]